MKTIYLIFLALLPIYVYATDLDSYKTSCELIGFKSATPEFGECVLELRRKDKQGSQVNNQSNAQSLPPKAKIVLRGDGSQGDEICQKYGFKVGESDYRQCRLDLRLAKEQAEAQKKIYDAQMRQHHKQKRIYEAQVAEMEKKKRSESINKIITYGLGLASGKTAAQAAPALIGQPMMPNTPRQVIQPVYIQPLNNQSYQCRYDAWRKIYNCN